MTTKGKDLTMKAPKQFSRLFRRLALAALLVAFFALALLTYASTIVNWSPVNAATGESALAMTQANPAVLNDRIELEIFLLPEAQGHG